MGFFDKLRQGLARTRENVSGQINNIMKNFRTIDEELFEELSDTLIMADIGIASTGRIIEELKDVVKRRNIKNADNIKELLADIIAKMMSETENKNILTDVNYPIVITVIGVNGVGKTTSIGKIAALYKAMGKKVILAAADTFRAAAIDQLCVWAERAGVEVIKHTEGSDPAAVIFDACAAAKARKADVLICDTAGRLHNKKNLMGELSKIKRVVDRELPDFQKESLLVLDATTGQNGVNQAREFKEVAGLTGVILTKLDGTAKGGIVVAVRCELGLSVKFVGLGEAIDDMQIFDEKEFAAALFE